MKKVITLFIAVFAITLTDFPQAKRVANKPNSDDMEQLYKFGQFYKYLSDNYIDQIDMQPLIETAIKDILLELDPHSAYISADDMKGVEESFNGEFSGIGIEFTVHNDTLIVVNTIVGAPAESVGIAPNDRIISIDNQGVIGISIKDVPSKLRGKRGSKVGLGIMRSGVSDSLNFVVIRDNIPINTVDAAYMFNDSTAYIKVNRFGQTTMQEFRGAFDKFDNPAALIVDFRSNGGGLLNQAIEMSNFFLPKGSRIVSTEGRAMPSHSFEAQTDGEYLDGKVIILIDENSASASEIVAGALQDWDRGIIVGQPSFGKGLVQRQYPLLDGSAARITVAHYLTPSGRKIQREYTKGNSEEYFKRHKDRFNHTNDSLSIVKDPLPHPEFETLKLKRKVYGAGGITPDIVIHEDTTRASDYYYSLIRQGVVNEFVISYLDTKRKHLEKDYPTFESFKSKFEVNDDMLQHLQQLGDKAIPTIKRSTQNNDWKSIARINIKALIAQRIFSTTEFYIIVNEGNKSFNSFLEEALSLNLQ